MSSQDSANPLTHFDDQGRSRMVDVTSKDVTSRFARASGRVQMAPQTQKLIRERGVKKGDVLEVARLAGIMAAKKTSDLIPLCHPLPLASVEIEFGFPDDSSVVIEARVRVEAKTGAEIEAMVAVSITAMTIYDMCKSVDRAMSVHEVRLEEKSGGKSGHFQRVNSSENVSS